MVIAPYPSDVPEYESAILQAEDGMHFESTLRPSELARSPRSQTLRSLPNARQYLAVLQHPLTDALGSPASATDTPDKNRTVVLWTGKRQ